MSSTGSTAAMQAPAIIVGAGIGGLMCALALQRHGLRCLVLERDPPPPEVAAARDAAGWRRNGAPQALHPHFLMGRLRELITARYPELLAELLAAGAGESELTDYLHPLAQARHRSQADDARLRTLEMRRTTLEWVVRRYVQRQPDITLRSDARVLRLLTDTRGGTPCVTGVDVEVNGATESIDGALVIDASGRFSKLAEQLGVPMQVEQTDSGLWYFTRHYQRHAGQPFPMHSGIPGAIFQDFIVGALPADNGAFTVTFQIYREDREIAKALRDPEHFQAMCMRIARVRPWVDPARAAPTSDVFGFGQMDSFWRRLVVDGRALVHGYFPLGDACVRSNPKFGRGCTWTSVAAHALADIIAAEPDPGARLVAYEQRLHQEFRADWETMRAIDGQTTTTFEIAAGRRRASWRDRLVMRFEQLVNDACLLSGAFFREIWCGYHGFQDMKAWTRRPSAWLHLLGAVLRMPSARPAFAALEGRPSRTELAQTTAGAHVEHIN